MVDIIFDAQTSGGLILSVPEDKLGQAGDLLGRGGDMAAHIGSVESTSGGEPGIVIS